MSKLLQQLADHIEALILGQSQLLLEPVSETIEMLAQKFYSQLCEKKKVELKPIPPVENDPPEEEKEDALVKLNTLSHVQVNEIGSEWLCLQAIQQLNLPEFFTKQDWNEKQINIALTHRIEDNSAIT
ncbi:MAG: hypothetical protein HYR67_07635, partial [Bacteroidetes bacterium]|nr:hypothetical protein [Bacteroidota bacterium]